MGVLCFKPLSFCINEPSLYPCNVVGILINVAGELMFLRGGIFLNNPENVDFAWIFFTRNMTSLKMRNDVLTFL